MVTHSEAWGPGFQSWPGRLLVVGLNFSVPQVAMCVKWREWDLGLLEELNELTPESMCYVRRLLLLWNSNQIYGWARF